MGKRISFAKLIVILGAVLTLIGCSSTSVESSNTQKNEGFSNLQKGIDLYKHYEYDDAAMAVYTDIKEFLLDKPKLGMTSLQIDEYSLYSLAHAQALKTREDFSLRLSYLVDVKPIKDFISQEEIDKLKDMLKPSIEQDIYAYEIKMWNTYDHTQAFEGDPDITEANVHIKTSKEFHKPIIEVYRATKRIDLNVVQNMGLSDAEIDTLGMTMFKQIGFIQKGKQWYYQNKEVDMGTPLPTPDSMKQKPPEEGRALKVQLELKINITEKKELQISGKTNLPDGMKLAVELSNPTIIYKQQSYIEVSNGQFTTSFSDSSQNPPRLKNGTYIILLVSNNAQTQPDQVKGILGEKARNLTGEDVMFDVLYGNKIKLVQNASIN